MGRAVRKMAMGIVVLASMLAVGCHHSTSGDDDEATKSGGDTPVTIASVVKTNIVESIDAPARTEALAQVKVTAPFAGTLVSLDVAEGDTVRAGERIGRIVAKESDAAIAGAKEMQRTAKTDAQKKEADRALELAEQSRVEAPLTAPTSGVVVSRAASPGDRIAEGDAVLSIASAGSTVVIADVAQSDLARIRPGEGARVTLAGGQSIAATVHAILPAANASDLSARVRLDVDGAAPTQLGLFGTARIAVGARAGVLAVPPAALIRDDVNGTTKIALVSNEGTARWVDVVTGARDPDHVEVTGDGVADGAKVIVAGQVGLPDGAPVVQHAEEKQ